MRHIFIINPAAGKKDGRQRVYAMAEALKKNHDLDIECMLTKSRGHAMMLTRAIAETGENVRFYACGGDGTVNEIANGIAGFPNAAMTCIRRDNAAVERCAGEVWEPAGFDLAMTVYDLLTNPNGRPVLAHEWCAHTSFHAVQGGTVSGTLMIHPEQSAQPFAGKLPLLRRACTRLGGEVTAGGDFSAVLPVFDCLPVLLRFWEADEEFPAQLQLLWDRNTCRYLRYETTFYLTGEILRRLREAAEK